ncbi:MAG: FAD-dependent oxidoreductase [Desulfobacterales bacterium]
MEHVVIIGGGGTGAALAHDLVLRGFKVSLYERGELLSGTTGRHHGLLHSGARYAVNDPQAAIECIQENKILRQIAPQAIEQNDGLFVAMNDADMAYRRIFLEKCEECGIPILELRAEQALAIEPALHPEIKMAVQVPDATMDAWRLPMCFFATARANGADIHSFAEVTGVHITNETVTGVQILDHKTHREFEVKGDLFVNAAGAWSGAICSLAGIQLPIQPGPGVMLALKGRLINMVISRLHKAAEGDIIVPQRNLTILGTTLWLTENPDAIEIPADHVQKITDLCSEMVPVAKNTPIHSVWCASRPLIKQAKTTLPQEISRAFDYFDHRRRDNLEGLISVIGGKATTLRAMAEKSADSVCRKTGRNLLCQTKTEKLMHWRMFYQ